MDGTETFGTKLHHAVGLTTKGDVNVASNALKIAEGFVEANDSRLPTNSIETSEIHQGIRHQTSKFIPNALGHFDEVGCSLPMVPTASNQILDHSPIGIGEASNVQVRMFVKTNCGSNTALIPRVAGETKTDKFCKSSLVFVDVGVGG